MFRAGPTPRNPPVFETASNSIQVAPVRLPIDPILWAAQPIGEEWEEAGAQGQDGAAQRAQDRERGRLGPWERAPALYSPLVA